MQWQMVRAVQGMFPHLELEEDHKHAALGQQHGGAREYLLELDLYVPGHELGFEYNGAHHYREVAFYGPLDIYRRRDEAKRALCRAQGIRLVEVPYWWDGRVESLAATLHRQLPAFVEAELSRAGEELSAPDSGEAVDHRRLLAELQEGRHEPIADVEEHMRAERRRLGSARARAASRRDCRVWRAGEQEVAGLLMAEIQDGMRVHWNGRDRLLATDRGRRIAGAPDWWLAGLPADVDVDGVLFMGRAGLGTLVAAAFLIHDWADSDRQSQWEAVRLVAHDMAPPTAGLPLSARLDLLGALPPSPSFEVAAYRRCEGEEDLQAALGAVGAGGGGFLLRDPAAPYAYGRQGRRELRALQSFTAEMEFVAANEKSRSFSCRSPAGKLQAVQVSALEHARPPPPGTLLPVRHFGLRFNSGRLKWPYLCPEAPADA